MRVLVVEDEPDLGDVFRDFLLELGHLPLVVRTAEAALGQLRSERPDAIILDIHLPGMSGLEFLQLRPVKELGVPVAMSRPLESAPRADRRRLQRTPLAIPVRVVGYNGAEHHATTVELGAMGMKARLAVALEPRSVVKLTFTPPDGGPAITVMSLVMRVDADGHAFAFVNPELAEVERLKGLVQRRVGV